MTLSAVLGALSAAGDVIQTKLGQSVTIPCGVDTFRKSLVWNHGHDLIMNIPTRGFPRKGRATKTDFYAFGVLITSCVDDRLSPGSFWPADDDPIMWLFHFRFYTCADTHLQSLENKMSGYLLLPVCVSSVWCLMRLDRNSIKKVPAAQNLNIHSYLTSKPLCILSVAPSLSVHKTVNKVHPSINLSYIFRVRQKCHCGKVKGATDGSANLRSDGRRRRAICLRG